MERFILICNLLLKKILCENHLVVVIDVFNNIKVDALALDVHSLVTFEKNSSLPRYDTMLTCSNLSEKIAFLIFSSSRTTWALKME
jgi:hypothetical protein